MAQVCRGSALALLLVATAAPAADAPDASNAVASAVIASNMAPSNGASNAAPQEAAPANAAASDITNRQSVFVLPKTPAEGKDPFFPRSSRPYNTQTIERTNLPAPANPAKLELKLNGISGLRATAWPSLMAAQWRPVKAATF